MIAARVHQSRPVHRDRPFRSTAMAAIPRPHLARRQKGGPGRSIRSNAGTPNAPAGSRSRTPLDPNRAIVKVCSLAFRRMRPVVRGTSKLDGTKFVERLSYHYGPDMSLGRPPQIAYEVHEHGWPIRPCFPRYIRVRIARATTTPRSGAKSATTVSPSWREEPSLRVETPGSILASTAAYATISPT